MPLHPQAVAALAQMPAVWRDPVAVRAMTASEARALMSSAASDEAPLPAGVSAEEISISGPAGPLPGRVYRPRATPPIGTVLWIRGGGFVLGSLATDRVAAPLSLTSQCAVVSLEYRLAPEHPFPAARDDCFAALRWVAQHARELGGVSGPVGIGGDSAGGNLAAVVARLARDDGGPAIAQQVLLYPMTAHRFDGPSRSDPDLGALAGPEAIEWIWRHYLADAADGADPSASPLQAEPLAGLPPALVLTAEYDVLRDEGEAYARRLADAGVAVELHRYDGMFHGFADCLGTVDAAGECVEAMGRSLRRALAR